MNKPEEPSPQDWDALFELAGTGVMECPWGWSGTFEQYFPGWGEDEFLAAVSRCSAYLQAKGLVG